MNRDTLLLIISILIMVAFEAYTAISGSNPGKLVLSLPLVSILTTFLLFIYLISKAEQRLSQTLDRRLPVFEYIDSRKEVEIEITQLAGQASELIVATGGRSRNREYLQVIEHKVRSGDLTYWRLIYNRPITREMCEHICSVISNPNVMVGQIEDKEYGNILVVDAGFIIALPMPGHGGLMGIKIPNSTSAQRMFRYLMMVYPNAKKISTPQEVQALCEKCANSVSQNV